MLHRLLVGLTLLFTCLLPQAHAEGRATLRPPLPVVVEADLPPEARDTLRLIERGGPFPYRRDGIEFGNRERRLPLRGRGFYKEYTVPTPGSSDRGARRIVTGRDGARYYTSDHYRSFRRIVP